MNALAEPPIAPVPAPEPDAGPVPAIEASVDRPPVHDPDASAEGELEREREHDPEERVRIYVWQIPVRLTHWVTAACIVILSLTGGYIADPFLIPPKGSVMTTIRLVHIVTAFVFLGSGLFRTYWLLRGNRFARWSAFIPTNRRQLTELFRQAGFYGYIRREIPKVLGHNQLAASAYVLLFVLLLVEIVTGFALDGLLGTEPGATAFGWVRQLLDAQTIRLIHHGSMWAILAIALFHVYSCLLVDNIEKNGLVSSIVNGYKFPTREEVLESRDGGAELLAEVDATKMGPGARSPEVGA